MREKELPSDASIPAITDKLVSTSGKMVLLDKLLPTLKQGNHRVLLFSQVCLLLLHSL